MFSSNIQLVETNQVTVAPPAAPEPVPVQTEAFRKPFPPTRFGPF